MDQEKLLPSGMLSADWLDRKVVVLALLFAAAIPLFYPAIPPLVDVPGHMARYRVMIGTDADVLSQWFQFEWKLIGYIGFDVLVSGLARLIGLEPAVKLLTITIPVVTVAGILLLSRVVHGRIQPAALFAVPFAYHMIFQYGFLNYTLSMGLVLLSIALWIWLGRRGKEALRAILFVPISCLVWLFHVSGWMVLGLTIFMVEWATRLERREPFIRATFMAGISCIPLCLPMLAFLSWSPTGEDSESDYLASLRFKPLWLLSVLRDRWQAHDTLSLAVVLVVFYHGVRSPSLRYSRPLVAAAAGLFGLFLAMPFLEAYADARLAPYIFVLLLIAIGPGDQAAPGHSRLFVMAGLAFIAIRLVASTISMGMEWNDWKPRLAALQHIPRGSRVASFTTFKCAQGWRMERTGHMAALAIVRRASFANDQYDLGPSALLTIKGSSFGKYAMDPSQMVVAKRCSEKSTDPTLADALAGFPRNAFTHVWLINPSLEPGMTKGLQPLWSDGRDILLKIDHDGQTIPTPQPKP